jgi:transposase
MDLTAHCQADRAALRVLIQYQPSLTSLSRYGLELPATRKARATTRRESHCPVEEQALADAKKNAAAHRRTIVFVDESGLSERPTRVRTWSPKAQTPVLQYSFNWKQLSLIACISYWQFYFRLFSGSIKGPQIIEFLKALKAQIKRKLLIIWDGLKVHKSRLVRDFIESLNGQIEVEFLPAYAPELNPVEYIWGHLKQHEMANLCVNHFGELSPFARNRLRSMQRRPQLIAAFWTQAELTF